MRRDIILEAAAQVFSQDGYHKAAMDEIARCAGVAKGTLYYHFPSKKVLFQVLVTEGLTMMMDTIRAHLQEDVPMALQIRKAIEVNLDLYLMYSGLASIFFSELSKGIDPEVLDSIEALKDEYTAFIGDLLREAVHPKHPAAVDYKLTASGILGMLDGMCRHYLKHKGRLQPEDILSIMESILTGWLQQ